MKCFQILNDEVLIINGDKEYKDTKAHFVADGGSLGAIKVYTKGDKPEEVEITPTSAIYDDVQRHCVVNEGWYQYPNATLDAYIAAVDTYLNAKAAREYVPPVPPTLEELKAAKLQEVKNWTESKITGGFTSDCTGSMVKYDSDKETQLTMQGIALNVNTELFAQNYPSGCPVRGYAEGSDTKTVFMLSPEQVLRWCAHLSMHIGSCKVAGWEKQAEVEAAQSKDDLEKIVLD